MVGETLLDEALVIFEFDGIAPEFEELIFELKLSAFCRSNTFNDPSLFKFNIIRYLSLILLF